MKAREKASDQVAFGFSFKTDWSRKRLEFYWAIHSELIKTKEILDSRFRCPIENCCIIVTDWEGNDRISFL